MPFSSGKKFRIRTVIVIVLPFVVLLALLTIGIYIFLRSRKLRERLESKIILFHQSLMLSFSFGDDDINSMDFLQYDFKTIKDATDDFSTANKLGQGGFGIVYKVKLLNGQEVAVKRLAPGSQQGDLEFKNEVLLVAKMQHRNLVRLRGFCFERNERLLIYEFLPNSSLDRFIFDPVQRQYLDWARRYKIIVGISRGLMYLHEDSRFKVIHHDLKASNILLDAELNPKINDFGMARLCSFNQSNGDTSKIKGTYGYMTPEYALYGHFSVKLDVFSFGVLLLEIISAQKNDSFQDGENIEHLLSYVREHSQPHGPFEDSPLRKRLTLKNLIANIGTSPATAPIGPTSIMYTPALPLPKTLAIAFTIFPMVKAQNQPTLLPRTCEA
ncbi:unnamed protein product [Citrullus colocynthis]|uniref:Protein kinase domain-containing protein n=1 Tax=Citrullus colocynthis TaxID=252529 RepID=A0ABP0YPK6_9ROSI